MSIIANCPRCGSETDSLQTLDKGLISKIQQEGGEAPPNQVCENCFTELAGSVARGSLLLAREKAKEQKKLMMWKSRVNFIKRARQYQTQRAFSDAAVEYEKYIRILEIVYEVPSGELTPELFKDSARTQELTIVASTYWDLLRIYDTSEKYGDRQMIAAQKLALFLRFTPLYGDIIRKAESFAKSAKNPSAFRFFLKSASESRGRCFIATAAFNSPYSEEVIVLQNWKDHILSKSIFGQIFIKAYYFISPPIAYLLDQHPQFKPSVRWILRKLCAFLKFF